MIAADLLRLQKGCKLVTPSYRNPRKDHLLEKTEKILSGIMKNCVLCPHRCRVDRTAGFKGLCGLGVLPMINRALPHHGEEPVLSGSCGAGTVFFSSCNMRCIYCQNYQISHGSEGDEISPASLSDVIVGLQNQGCHNIDAVTPTPHLAGIIAALKDASKKGLSIPLVYNCGGYENSDIIKLLDGIVDVYLPDFKYGNDRHAFAFSGVSDYVLNASASVREMVRQVGDSLEVEDGIALRGMIIRHLVLPGGVANSLHVLRLIRDISVEISLSIMSQYTPTRAVAEDPLLGRRVTRDEYETVVNAALDMGFDNIFVQEVSEEQLTPDFDREDPFSRE